MISVTWNAPIEAFNREGNFFEGNIVYALPQTQRVHRLDPSADILM